MAVTLSAAMPAWAQWNIKTEAGVVAARGNTDTDSANSKFQVSYETRRWKPALDLSGVYASDQTGSTAQRWGARGQVDYKFLPQGFSFVSGRYEEDRFSGFVYQATYGAGLGWKFYDDPDTRLIMALGAGYKVLQTRDTLEDDAVTVTLGERQEELIGQFTIDFERALTDTTRIIDKFLVEAGATNVFVQNDISLEVRIMTSLALAVGYSVRHNTEPPQQFRKTDTLTTLNLVYELK